VIVYVQENISWAIGFLIPAVAMAIAVTLFQLGSGRYSHIKPAQRFVYIFSYFSVTHLISLNCRVRVHSTF
jgi:dipeptide/tripeptide permease